MSALSKVVRAGVGRRRVQTLVMTLTTMMAVTASVLAAGIIVAAHAPFDRAFASQHGAHLTAQFDTTRATGDQLAATAHVAGVTAAAGPFATLTLRPHAGANGARVPQGEQMLPMTFVARTDAGGPVDQLRLAGGVWSTGPGEIVLADNGPLGVGDRMTFPDLPGRPELRVVGLARSVAHSADGWVSPAQLAALTKPGTTAEAQMLYRFADAASKDQVTADRAALAAVVPQGSMTSAGSYLTVKLARDKSTGPFVPFVVAFGVLGLAMSVLIIGVVVSGAVGAATRRIGILKALGFTPAQVARAYVGQALIPTTVGAVLGVFSGNVAALPILNKEAHAFDAGKQVIPVWIDAVVPALALLAVVATALPSALRAGRLRTVEAIAVGRTPRAGGGQRARQLLGRLPLPRAISLGLGHPLARPGRSATMLAAVVLGTVGVTFGVGLAMSISSVSDGMGRARGVGDFTVQDIVFSDDSAAPPKSVDPSELAAKIAAQPGTGRYFGTSRTRVGVAGLAGPTTVTAYDGDSSWGALQMVSGSWFTKPGEAVVPSGFLDTTGTHIGDTVMLTNAGHSAPVKLVGEVFDMEEAGQVILTDRASLAGLETVDELPSHQFDIQLKPGVDATEYQSKLNNVLPNGMISLPTMGSRVNPTLLAMDTLAAMLTLMLVATAGLGVLNTVVLDTRERVHDFGVYKALGMSPKQTAAMMLTSVASIGLLAGLVGVPLGVVLHHRVMPVMGHAAGTRLPAADVAVYGAATVVPLLLGGLVIAVAGAALPAGWAARARTATALRTE
jgi:putative ABC transport system permease protein